MTKKLALTSALIAWSILLFAQSYEIQLINNTSQAPNGPGTLVDVYLNDSLFTSAQALDFKDATALISLPANEPLRVSIAASPSDSVQQSFVSFNFNNFAADEIYALVIDGAFGNPDNPLRLEVATNVQRFSSIASQVALRAYNGNRLNIANQYLVQRQGFLSENLNKGSFGNYLNFSAGLLVLDLFEQAGDSPVNTYSFDFSSAGGLAFTVINGFDSNTNQDLIYAVTADGQTLDGQLLDAPGILINEIDYNQPGTDGAEFVELKNIGQAELSFENYTLEFWNGSVDQAYNTISLPDFTLAADDYYVVCFSASVPNCDFVVSGSIQNGGNSPDGVLLLSGARVVDALSYEGNIPFVTEGDATDLEDGDLEGIGLSRVPDGNDSNNNGVDFQAVCLTPGAANQNQTDCASLVTDSTLVQVFNNYEGGAIDVYAGQTIIASNLAYQAGTAFVSIPAGSETTVSIVASGASIAEAFLSVSTTFLLDRTYQLIAEGTEGNASLVTYDLAQSQSRAPFSGDVNVYHGVEGGPALDVLIKSVGLIESNLQYQGFSGYTGVLPDVYLIELITPDNQEVIATFELDMRQSFGRAQTILISNELSDPSSLQLTSIDAEGAMVPLELVEFARVQLIHNIPNIVVDLYVDDRLVADNVNYRSASSFLELRANQDLVLEVKAENSTPASEAILSFAGLRFAALSSSIVVLGGDGTEDRPVDIFTLNSGAQLAAQNSEQVDLAFFHGATDVDPLSVSGLQMEPILADLGFGQFSAYQAFAADDLVLLAEGGMPANSLDFYGLDLSSKAGQSGLVFSSGVVGGSETFGLFIAFSDGEVLAMDTLDVARIQLVHNVSNDLNYDVYLNGDFFAGPLGFQEATPYLNILAETIFDLSLVPTGAPIDSAILTQENLSFLEDSTYQVFVNGQMEFPDQPGPIFVNDAAREVNLADLVYDVTLFHGALDLVDLDFQVSDGTKIGENIAYGQFEQTLGLVPANTVIELIESESQNSICGFDLPLLSFPQTSPLVIFTSRSATPERTLELLAVFPDGQVIPLQKTAFARLQIINLLSEPNNPVDVYLNGERIADDLDFRNATAYQIVPAGQELTLAIAPQNSLDDSAPLVSQLLNPTADQLLAAFIAPSADDGAIPYEIFLNDQAEIDAGGTNKFTFNFFNGNFDFNNLDLALQGITTLYQNVPYGEFTDYTLIEPLSSDPRVTFELTSAQNDTFLAEAFADFSEYDNLGATIFTSGFLTPDSSPAVELWIVLPDGRTLPLELIVDTKGLSELLPELILSPNPSVAQANLDFYLKERADLTIHLIHASGKLITERRLPNLSPGKHRESFEVRNLPAGMYFMRLQSGNRSAVLKLNVQR